MWTHNRLRSGRGGLPSADARTEKRCFGAHVLRAFSASGKVVFPSLLWLESLVCRSWVSQNPPAGVAVWGGKRSLTASRQGHSSVAVPWPHSGKGGPRCKEGMHLREASLTETQTRGQAPSRPRFVCRVAEENENTWGRGTQRSESLCMCVCACVCACLRVPSSFPSQ